MKNNFLQKEAKPQTNDKIPNQRSQSAKQNYQTVQSFYKQTVKPKETPNFRIRPQTGIQLKTIAKILELMPEKVCFEEIEVNQAYEMDVFIRNLSSTCKRFRVTQPKTLKFRIDHNLQGSVAPGLSTKLTVKFGTEELVDLYDEAVIVFQDDFEQKQSILLSLEAKRPQCQLNYPEKLDFEFVKTNEEVQKVLTFFNSGRSKAQITLNCENIKNIHIEPPSFQIFANQKIDVKVYLSSKNVGNFMEIISVLQDNSSVAKNIIVSAIFFDYNKFVVDENQNARQSFDFGQFYIGQSFKKRFFLINNSPIEQKFKIKLKKGDFTSQNHEQVLQTPEELGRDILEKIIEIEPETGVLKAFSQVLLKKFAFTQKEEINQNASEKYIYTAFIDFDPEDKETLQFTVQGEGFIPQVKFSIQNINFGVCNAYDHRESIISVENQNKSLEIPLFYKKIPNFIVTPQQLTLIPFQQSSLEISFLPETVGSFQKNLVFYFINENFNIEFPVQGQSVKVNPKKSKLGGPENLPSDYFEKSKKFIEPLQNQAIGKNQGILSLTLQRDSEEDHKAETQHIENKQSNEQKLKHNEKYNQFLADQRNSRLQKEKDKILQSRKQILEKKITVYKQNSNAKQQQGLEKSDSLDGEGSKEEKEVPPIDYEFELGLAQTLIKSQDLQLPTHKEPLAVIKPYGDFEPFDINDKAAFRPDPNAVIRKLYQQKPSNHKEEREIQQELEGKQLKKIQVGPIKFDFGEIYIKSKVTKSFTVKNDLRQAIKVQLQTNVQELVETYQKAQIIPPTETALFEIALCSNSLDDEFKQQIKYIINDKYTFEIEVKAKISQVRLDLNKQLLKFFFNENNDTMITKGTLKIVNNGNAPGQFTWDLDSKVFKVVPQSGTIQPRSSFDVTITYKPSAGTGKQEKEGVRLEEEKLVMRVTDGLDQQIKCVGNIQEPRCQLRNSNMDLGYIIVSKEETRNIILKNNGKYPAIFKVAQESLPEFFEIQPTEGKIQPETSQEFKVKYCSSEPRNVKQEVQILVRGSKTIKLLFQAQVIIPEIEIQEKSFNFGKVNILGNSGELYLNIINNSSIPAELILDLRTTEEANQGIDCLKIECLTQGADESVMKAGNEDPDQDDESEESEQNQESRKIFDKTKDNQEETSQDNNAQVQSQKNSQTQMFFIFLKPKKQNKFILKFIPKEVRQYQFELPLTLVRFGKIQQLTRVIQCEGIKPRFLVEPSALEFPRKIIFSSDKCFANFSSLVISNPEKTILKWKIDTQDLKDQDVFHLFPTEGRIDPGQTFRVKVSFNPFYPQSYFNKVKMYAISEEDENQPSIEVILKGESAYPKLLFDRKEIIMPVVPLNIESKIIFKIFNDGYENMTLKHRVIEDSGNIKLDLQFPEGNLLGATKNKLTIVLSFKSAAPVSFTTKLEFLDDNSNNYIIPVSCTVDNCIFTNFPFLQRTRGEYIQKQDTAKGPILLVEDENQNLEQSEIGSVITVSKKKATTLSVASGKTSSSRLSSRTALGYSPIPKELMDASQDSIKRWLNYYVLETQIQAFPDSLVEENGTQLFQLLQFVTNKSYNHLMVAIDQTMKKNEKMNSLVKQWDQVIKQLKSEGALLNHIRPYYLLNYIDFLAYLKQQSKENDYILSSSLKLSATKYSYLHNDSWIALFYQILKIHYLAKINQRILKSLPNLQNCEKPNLPEQYLRGSNLFSQEEGILMRWLEINFECKTKTPIKLLNFDRDLRDCNVFFNTIQNFVGNFSPKLMSSIKKICKVDEDFNFNCEKLIILLNEIQISTQFISTDFAYPQQREILLFIISLVQNLPSFTPKSEVISFDCILGELVTKQLEITNNSTKAVLYYIKFDGSPDFSLQENDTMLAESKMTIPYNIKFQSRLSKQQFGRITFISKRERNQQASALVFELKATISGRVSLKVWEIQSYLYETKEFSIQINNTFQVDYADFFITIQHEYERKKEEQNTSAYLREQAELKEKEFKEEEAKRKQARTSTKKKTKKAEKPEKEDIEIFVPSFFTKTDRIKLKRGATFNLNMVFIPMIQKDTRCYVILNDPNVGEIQYEIVSKVLLPEDFIEIPKAPLQPALVIDEKREWKLQVPFFNENIKNCLKILEQWMLEKSRSLHNKTTLTYKEILALIMPDQYTFYIEPENAQSYIEFPSQIQMTNPFKYLKQKNENQQNQQLNQPSLIGNQKKGGKTQKGTEIANNTPNNQNNRSQSPNDTKKPQNETSSLDQTNLQQQYLTMSLTPQQELQVKEINLLNFTFNFKNPCKDYRLNFVLRNQNKTDYRRYRLQVSCIPKPISASLELVTPIHEILIQDLPIQNNTDKDWQVKVNFTIEEVHSQSSRGYVTIGTRFKYDEQNPKYSSIVLPQVPKEIVVRKKTLANIPICFLPTKICSFEASLNLQNMLTQDVFNYSLRFTGEEPLAEDHLVINCIAKKTSTQELLLVNPFQDQSITYTIETDLHGATGASSITIPPKSSKYYQLNITPILSGQHTGSITFTREDGVYVWWTIQLFTDSPPPDKVIELITTIRKPLIFEIELQNPLDCNAVFEVIIDGENLQGQQFFQIPPKKSFTYELFFLPLKKVSQRGSIAFVSEKLGEIWYQLNLEASEAQTIRLPILKTEIGKSESKEIILENPSNADVKVACVIENPTNFSISQENIVIPSQDYISIEIKYTPDTLNQVQTSKILFNTENIGSWSYVVQGLGLPPSPFEPKHISAPLNKESSQSIEFKNPLNQIIEVTINLELKDTSEVQVFKMLLPNSRKVVPVGVAPGDILSIPFLFIPNQIKSFECAIIVKMTDFVVWKLPILATTESFNSGVVELFKTKCRIKLEKYFDLKLPGIIFSNSQKGETLSFSYSSKNEECAKFLSKYVQIVCTKNQLQNSDQPLQYKLLFYPLKPFKTDIDFIVTRKSGGIWKFIFHLEAVMPAFDDEIILSSQLNKTTSVAFKLTNRSKDFATFQSYFLKGSDPEIEVKPKNGLLEPYGKSGTTFLVSFTPLEYSKTKKAILVIETDEMLWSYQIKGILPTYQPPKVAEGLVKNYLTPGMANLLTKHEKKNYLVENIKQLKEYSPSVKNKSPKQSQILNSETKEKLHSQRDQQTVYKSQYDQKSLAQKSRPKSLRPISAYQQSKY